MHYLTFNSETRVPNLGQQPYQRLSNPVTTRVETLRQGVLRPGPTHASLSERRVEPLSFAQIIKHYRRELPYANRELVVQMMREVHKVFDHTRVFSICGISIYPPVACKLFSAFQDESAERLAKICERDDLVQSRDAQPKNSPLEELFRIALCKSKDLRENI